MKEVKKVATPTKVAEGSVVKRQPTVKSLLADDKVQERFQKLLGKKAQGFISSVLSLVENNKLLATADPKSILNASAMGAILDLPINPNLGFAYIVPYTNKKEGRVVAQFQIGYKGFIQLAMRSGQFLTISATPVYEGQLVEENPLTGYVFDWGAKKSDKIIGYASYFKLVNGFEKTYYMTVEEVKRHGLRYSQSYKKGYGLWKDDFDAMALKTVLKLLLSKYAPLSIDMQKAVVVDQAQVVDVDTLEVKYPDNTKSTLEEEVKRKEIERLAMWIDKAKTAEDLADLNNYVYETEDEELIKKFEAKLEELKKLIDN